MRQLHQTTLVQHDICPSDETASSVKPEGSLTRLPYWPECVLLHDCRYIYARAEAGLRLRADWLQGDVALLFRLGMPELLTWHLHLIKTSHNELPGVCCLCTSRTLPR